MRSRERRRTRWARAILCAAPCFAIALTASGARADEPEAEPAPSATPDAPPAPGASPDRAAWQTRYAAARRFLVTGEYRTALGEFVALAHDATTEEDRRLALEMAQVALAWTQRSDASWPREVPKPPERPHRTSDEISILYTSGFLYGAGTGAWFLLQTQPDSALTATLPFIGIAAAPVIGVAIVDGAHPLPHGVPHGITAGMYLGLGEGIWLVGYQHSRADRVDATRTDGSSSRWNATSTSTVLWSGATVGAITGAVMTLGIPTTPGRVSFTASTTIWAGALTGFAVSAFVPTKDGHRSEDALLAAGIAYNVGLLGGIALAPRVRPSVARVRIVDLCGAGGGLATGGLYLAFAGSDANSRASMGLAALGAAAGLTAGWLATQGMPQDTSEMAAPPVSFAPTVIPIERGAALGVAGAM